MQIVVNTEDVNIHWETISRVNVFQMSKTTPPPIVCGYEWSIVTSLHLAWKHMSRSDCMHLFYPISALSPRMQITSTHNQFCHMFALFTRVNFNLEFYQVEVPTTMFGRHLKKVLIFKQSSEFSSQCTLSHGTSWLHSWACVSRHMAEASPVLH